VAGAVLESVRAGRSGDRRPRVGHQRIVNMIADGARTHEWPRTHDSQNYWGSM